MNAPIDALNVARPRKTLSARLQKVRTQSGIEVWLVEDHGRPLITLSFGFRGGASQDTPGRAGLATVLASMMTEGAGDLDCHAFQTCLDDKAIKLGFVADRDYFRGSLQTLTVHSNDAFDLLERAVMRPRFDMAAVERVLDRHASSLRWSEHNPDDVSRRLFEETAFADHSYGRPTYGAISSLAEISIEDLVAMHRSVFALDQLRVVVVGDMDPDAVACAIDRVFGRLPACSSLQPVVAPDMNGLGLTVIADLDVPQSTIRFGRPAIGRHDPDFAAALVVNHAFGGGNFSSRLFREVREKRGLCYSVHSQIADYDKVAFLSGGTTVGNERCREAIDVLTREVDRMRTEGLSSAEVEHSKRFLTGSYGLRFDTSRKIADTLLSTRLQGHASDWVERRNDLVEAVSLDDAQRVMRRLVGDGRLLMAIAGRPTI